MRKNFKVYKFVYIFFIVFFIAYKVYLIFFSKMIKINFWRELPIGLSSIAAILSYHGAKAKNENISAFVFYVGSFTSLMGLILPAQSFVGIPLFSIETIGYYGLYGLALVIGVTMFTFGFYEPKYKDVPIALLWIGAFSLLIHLINILFRVFILPDANYLYTYSPENNPLLNLLWSYIPHELFYLLPLLLVAAVVFYLATLIIRIFKKKDVEETEHLDVKVPDANETKEEENPEQTNV